MWQVYKNGVPNWKGHIGVVSESNLNNFKSIEGNTNKGKSRNGFIVWEHKHNILKEMSVNNGLRFIGFVYPTDYITPNNVKKTPAYSY